VRIAAGLLAFNCLLLALGLGLLGTAGLLLMFNVLIWRAFLQGKEIDCGCFGPGEALTWKTLVRDAAMLAGAVFVGWWALRGRRRKALA